MKVIDIHTHGIGGYDTQTTSVHDILKIAKLQGECGVSGILAAMYPSPLEIMRAQMQAVKDAMSMRTENAASILGIYLEGPFLNPAKCGALCASAFLPVSIYEFEKLMEGFEDVVKVMVIAPELDGAAALIRKASDRGVVLSLGHSDATYAEAEAGYRAGARGVTHLFDAMRGFHHREPGIAGFALLSRDMYVEIIADPYHLHRSTLDLIFRLKRQDRILIVSDSVKETKTESERSVSSESGMLLGGSATVTESFTRLVGMGYDADNIRRCITENAENYLGWK